MTEYSYKYDAQSYKEKNKLPYITIMLVAINVIVFIVLEMAGSTQDIGFMYRKGAMYAPDVFKEGQWYRMITSMFMHYGYEHLIGNMFMLLALGYQLEEQYGRIKYIITYFLCGISGNIISGMIEMASEEYSIGVGASGAIFGIFGVLLIMIFKSRKIMGQVSGVRLMVLFLVMIFGNMEEGVDWIAHLGGALTGVILAVVLYRPKKKKQLLNL